MDAKLIVSIVAVVLAVLSFALSQLAERRTRRAEAIKNLLGDKESVAFGALKLLRDGLPTRAKERTLVIDALMQACLLEGSDRARALLFRVIEENRSGDTAAEFVNGFRALEANFISMRKYDFEENELNFKKAERRLGAVRKVLKIPAAGSLGGPHAG